MLKVYNFFCQNKLKQEKENAATIVLFIFFLFKKSTGVVTLFLCCCHYCIIIIICDVVVNFRPYCIVALSSYLNYRHSRTIYDTYVECTKYESILE